MIEFIKKLFKRKEQKCNISAVSDSTKPKILCAWCKKPMINGDSYAQYGDGTIVHNGKCYTEYDDWLDC
jgi:hypothetical protein